jgi:hypothetical protein
MKQLYEIAQEKKLNSTFCEFPEGGHNDTPVQPNYMESIEKFFKELSL